MTDNTTLPGTGDVIADEDIAGVKHQLVKVEYGASGSATKVSPSVGLPVASQYLEVSGSASANNVDLVTQDASSYRWVSVQLTGAWVGTITFQTSNDNANWVSAQMATTPAASSVSSSATTTANGVFSATLTARYFRLRFTAYTSGTASAVVGFSVHPGWPASAPLKISANDNFSTADANGLGAAYGVSSVGYAYNNSNFDRIRTANAAKNTTGLGVPASGALGFDGTNYQALKVDSAGNQTQIAANLEVTASASSAATFLTQDVTGYRWVSVQLAGTFSATVTVEQSNDNSNWVTCLLNQANLNNSGSFSGFNAAGIYVGPLNSRYFRLRTSSYSSGTVNATAEFAAAPSATPTTAISTVSGTVSISGTSAGSGDGLSSGLTGVLAAESNGYLYNGSTWDRMRSFGTQGALGVTPTPGTTGGWSPSSQTALTSTKTQIKASAGTLGGYMIGNTNTTWAYVQVWDVASASITVGSTSPTYVLPIPPGAAANLELTCGVNHATAINVAATTTPTGSTAPTNALTCTFFYK